MLPDDYVAQIDRYGFCIVNDVLPLAVVDPLTRVIVRAQQEQAESGKSITGYVRKLLGIDEIRALCCSALMLHFVTPILGPHAMPVQAVLYDKTPQSHWSVAWHQDMAIAVKEQICFEGFGPWSVKDNVVFVQPPIAVLEKMISVRLHLDDCGSDNGPLRVIPGSHKNGALYSTDMARLKNTYSPIACTVRRGGILVMRPLLVHSSRDLAHSPHRRIIQVDYAADELPGGLQWAQ
jgi:ectoine hydroxylase-related dioxygenase (phytanoyl-CoA dioxygenase family)